MSSWAIDYDELCVINPPIAQGGYGIVNKAEYGDTTVAVKTILGMMQSAGKHMASVVGRTSQESAAASDYANAKQPAVF